MDIVVRAFLAFLFIFLLTRLIGRRELSTLQPFDLAIAVGVVLAVALFIWWRLGTPGRPGKSSKPGDDPVG